MLSSGYLNTRQHYSDQVVVGQQQGTNNTAVTHVLDDSWGVETEACEVGQAENIKLPYYDRGEAVRWPRLWSSL